MAERTFGKFELIRKIGQGGMAEIFLARQTGIEGFEKQCVLKMLLPHLMELRESREFVQMFLDEARLAARLSHPHVAQIYELGQADGRYYLAMEYVNGADLGRVLTRSHELNQPMPVEHAVRIIAIVCEALGYAHGLTDETGLPLGIIHRDVCPQNVLISYDGGIKLADFGVAKAASHVSKTNVGALKGRLDYMSPEQASGERLDARSDIFSVGALLYQLTTGELPFSGNSDFKLIEAIVSEMPRPPTSVCEDFPLGLSPIIGRAMAKSPSDRYASALELQLDLERFMVEEKLVSNAALIGQYLRPLLASTTPAADPDEAPLRAEPTVKVFVPVPGPYDTPSATRLAASHPAAAAIDVASQQPSTTEPVTTEEHSPSAEQTAQIAALGDMPTLMATRRPVLPPLPAEIPSEVFLSPSEIKPRLGPDVAAAIEVTVPAALAAAQASPATAAVEVTDRDRQATDGGYATDEAAAVEPVWAPSRSETTASEKIARPVTAPIPHSVVLAAAEPTVRWMPPTQPSAAAPATTPATPAMTPAAPAMTPAAPAMTPAAPAMTPATPAMTPAAPAMTPVAPAMTPAAPAPAQATPVQPLPASAVRPAAAPTSNLLRMDPVREVASERATPGHLSTALADESGRQQRPANGVLPAVAARPSTPPIAGTPMPALPPELADFALTAPQPRSSRRLLAVAIGAGALIGIAVTAILVGRGETPATAVEADAAVLVTSSPAEVSPVAATRTAAEPDAAAAPVAAEVKPVAVDAGHEPEVRDAGSAPEIVAPRPPKEIAVSGAQPRGKRASSQKAQELCQQGNKLILQGKFEEAATLFKEALEMDPTSSDAKRGLGIANGRLDRDPRRLFDQGNRAILKGRYDEAVKQFELALQADANFAEAHRGLGLAHSKLGKNGLAARHYLAYVTLRPRAPDADRVREMIKQLESSKKP